MQLRIVAALVLMAGLAAGETLTVAVVSSTSEFCNPAANLRHFEELITEAVSKGARLVCFPELSLMSYTLEKEILAIAEEIPGPSTRKLEAIARGRNVYVSVGLAEKDGEKYHIAQALIGPSGYIGKYRKHHPTDTEQKAGFTPGERFSVFDVDGFRFGFNICFDGRHEDTLAAMKEARVDLIHHPHGNYLSLGKDAEEWTRGKMVYFVPRATSSRAFILINNSAGDLESPNSVQRFGSGAMVIDPLGQVVDRTMQHDRAEKMIVVKIEKPLSALIPAFEMKHLDK